MNVLVNNGRRRLGIPGRPGIVIAPNEIVELDAVQERAMLKNRTVQRWLESNILEIRPASKRPEKVETIAPKREAKPARKRVDRDQREIEVLPEGVSETGTHIHHKGGGWYAVYVNGFKVTDTNIRKDEAEAIASEY